MSEDDWITVCHGEDNLVRVSAMNESDTPVYPTVGEFRYSANLAEASSPISVCFPGGCDDDCEGDEGWSPMPFQVANARHSRRRAESMIADYVRRQG
jgi:hypothetical protein